MLADFLYNAFSIDISVYVAQISALIDALPPEAQRIISVIKFISGITSLALFGAVVVLIYRLNRLMFSSMFQNVTASFSAESLPTDKIGKQWEKVRERIDRNTEAEWKLAVIEADKLVDDILKRMGYPGESMADRLKAVKPEQLASLEALWDAHKLRNTIVHDPEFYASELEIKNAIDHYETFLREVQAII